MNDIILLGYYIHRYDSFIMLGDYLTVNKENGIVQRSSNSSSGSSFFLCSLPNQDLSNPDSL